MQMAFDPKNVQILLVEDTAVMRKIEIKTLKSLGFEGILEAVDGDEAIAILQGDQKVDLIISDWNMPNKDGYELLCWVRNNADTSSIPFLMATGQGDKAQEKKAVDAGVSAFVAKPFNEAELKAKIDEAFGLIEQEGGASPISKGPRESVNGRVKLKVAHIQITDHIILGVLKHLIARGELQPQHFELETVCMPGWNPVQTALEKGEVDAAFILAPIAMDLYSFGVPIKLTLLAHKNGSISVRSNRDGYGEPYADYFRSKSFFIPHKMSVHHILAHLFFSSIGLTPGMVGEGQSDVNFEVVAPIKMQEFLQSNKAAAGFMVAEPLGTKAIASGVASLQFLSSELWENHPCCCVTMRDDFIEPHTDAVYEFTEMLVAAGKFVEQKPEMAAEIGVAFLDPNKTLGLKVPVLKNVLSEEKGIKTGDLYPAIDDLRTMNDYMVKRMRIGGAVDMDAFVDTRFADAACKDRVTSNLPAYLHIADDTAIDLLSRHAQVETGEDKSMLNLEGKYLTFSLDGQEYGIDILRIKEIIGMPTIRSIPQAPPYIRGVINLRGRTIPVIDLRAKFKLGTVNNDERSCIVVLESHHEGKELSIGVAVDSVSEVMTIRSTHIDPTPSFGARIDTRHILAMAKADDGIKMLLDIDHVLQEDDGLARWVSPEDEARAA
jgi:chemotaxis signal transduction protein/ABC-type nitrate/sulfonate/bicarbonate transport system substrate-binding protein/CheY-like chemotaxis protein